MKTVKKTLALLLAMVLLVGLVPMAAMAALYSGGGEGNYTSAYLDLSSFLNRELSAVPLDYVIGNLTDYSGNPISVDGTVAAYAKSDYSYNTTDDFMLIGKDGMLDLSPEYSYVSSGTLMLVIGTPDQLARTNRFIRVRVTYPDEEFVASAWTADGDDMTVSSYSEYQYQNSSTGSLYTQFYMSVKPDPNWTESKPLRVRLQPRADLTERGVTVKAYAGNYERPEDIPSGAEELTDTLVYGETGFLMEDRYSIGINYMDVTFVWSTGDSEWAESGYIYVSESRRHLSPDLYYFENSSRYYAIDTLRRSGEVYTIGLKSGLPIDKDYIVTADYYDYDRYNNDAVAKIVIGTFDSLEAAESAEDIKDKLLSSSYDGGLTWNFAQQGSLNLTLFDNSGSVMHQTFTVTESEEEEEEEEEETQNPLSADVYFRVRDAYDPVYGVSPDTYVMSYEDDSYYPRGYQTLFILNRENGGEPIKAEELQPYFWHAEKAHIYASFDGASGERQESGKNIVPVTYGKPIHYSASAEDGTNLKQYYVTFVTQKEGSALFVNGATNSEHIDDETGLPMRTVVLDSEHDFHHDIFFANFGDVEMTGLKVTLEDASGIKLHDYWTIRTDSVGTLPPFNEDSLYTRGNYGKIRLVPEDENAFASISGKLTISADGVDPVTILLTGTVGKPKITTTAMKSGAVKYVPYSTLIQTNYIGDATDAITFSITKGSLPDGVILKPNGEVYGVPLETGTFTFTVEASVKDVPNCSDSRAYTLIVVENTDENVENATDLGYELIDRIPRVITPADYLFHSKGELSEFIAVYLDGRELIQNTEYLLEEGSTKITILEETFGDEEEGDHTIAAEFRIDGDEDGEMKRVAQNFTLEEGEEEPEEPVVNPPKQPAIPSVPSQNQVEPTPAPEPEPEKPVKTFKFVDVPKNAWFYDDVKWVFDRDLMVGVSETMFDPDGPVDAATIVMVLARTIGVDLTQFADSSEIYLPQDQWYSAAANWATQMGLIDDSFERNKPYSRGQMAVLLYKYFKYIGIDCRQPDPTVEFADADLMTPEQNEAYQVLYKYGIFKGVGNNRMDVYGNTSRAQLAALMHRVKEFIDSKI